ncbi:hypothetical protein BDZ97DRAFT_1725283 [Flammula alnicola]|nr:hypothetical protein BDZ97DRAFT_1725283 [Flammula alnicola]
MTDYIRRLVSGNKARFKDHNLNVELDLVYVTDQVIIMGYPASGIEGLYRNRREDAIRFLEHRHGKNYWVFNFCPIKENSYDADEFEGRVSRYPFPDHHAPPLAMMPLVAREMHVWLKGSPDRVAVLHCKAGKGRSGTMACAYLLSLDDSPMPPQLERSYTAKEWAKRRMECTIDALPSDDENQLSAGISINPLSESPLFEKPVRSDTDGILDVDTGASSPRSTTPNPEKSFTDALKGVLDLHTARRMKPPSEKDPAKAGKVKQGVSIPSQRRFLYYWALLLAHEAPKDMWAVTPTSTTQLDPTLTFKRSTEPRPKVRLTQLKLRMRETSGVKMGVVRAANMVIEKTGMAKGPTAGSGSSPTPQSQVWASLARYDDRLVDLLEEWEAYTRDPDGHLGKKRHGSEHLSHEESTEEEVPSQTFNSGKWDKGKMVRSFARLGVVDGSEEMVVDEKGEKILVYTLCPLSEGRWQGLKHDLHAKAADAHHERQETLKAIAQHADATGMSHSEANSMNDVTTTSLDLNKPEDALVGANLDKGIVLDAGRELRVKLYVGQVFIGWFWFIPTFHMLQPPPSPTPSSSSNMISTSTSTSPSPASLKTTFSLTRKDLDFPLGLGSAIIDVDIDMEWVVPMTDVPVELEPPLSARTEDSVESEPLQSGLAAAVQAVVGGEGQGGLREALEAKQGAAD